MNCNPEAPPYTSNTSLEEIAQRLTTAQRVTLLTHARPDGDAVGSTLALARTLNQIGKDATPIYTGPWSRRFDSLVARTKTRRVGEASQLPAGDDEPDTIVILDTGSWTQLPEATPWLKTRAEKTIVIDHHRHGDPEIGLLRYIDKQSAAACEPVAKLCQLLLGAPDLKQLPLDIAEPLYLGIATDTGWFKHANVSADVLKLAACLLDAGVDHARLYVDVEQSDTVSRMLLMGRALSSLELHADEKFAVMRLTKKDFRESGGDITDAGGLNDMPMSIASVRASCVLIEVEDDLTKISLRSKAAGSSGQQVVDVNEIARGLGGGGHQMASGARIQAPLDEAVRIVVEAAAAQIR